MDFESLIDKYTLERVEDMFSLYGKFGNELPTLSDFLLDVIDKFFLPFSAKQKELPIKIEDLETFLVCIKFYRDNYILRRYGR
ncbi:p10 [Beet pseudoyellows virus]|uniref:p10 n=2 Tax=Beet pseudoyellows virus TaxID=72750 RepID=Q6VRA2_9CLOS|nr:p10 [Beet pseudoyellows virus]AAQ97389.1 p10 [Beet pseudoyellows virus]BAC66366.1 9.8 kDa protein [Cucumber yellows virus]BAV38110.1 p10 protein [Beet pseudoyellows virus]